MKIWNIFITTTLCILLAGNVFSQSDEQAYEMLQEEISLRMEPYRGKDTMGKRIKIGDLTDLYGEDSMKINGFGIVTGLNGTGDTGEAALELLLKVASKHGLRIEKDDLKKGNVALVSLSAEVKPHERVFDVAVKAVSDSKSLQNGFLEASTMNPVGSSEVYAVVSGPIALGGRFFGAQGEGGEASVTTGHPTVGYVLGGGEFIKDLHINRLKRGKLVLFLKHPNERTATNIAGIINTTFEGLDIEADPHSNASVEVTVPDLYFGHEGAGRLTQLIADISDLSAEPHNNAMITIDQGAGVIAISEGVKMESGSVAVAGLTVKVSSELQVAMRQGLTGGETKVVETPSLDVQEGQANFLLIPRGTDLVEVQSTLNALHLPPTSMISVLTAMHRAGMIHADLVVIPR